MAQSNPDTMDLSVTETLDEALKGHVNYDRFHEVFTGSLARAYNKDQTRQDVYRGYESRIRAKFVADHGGAILEGPYAGESVHFSIALTADNQLHVAYNTSGCKGEDNLFAAYEASRLAAEYLAGSDLRRCQKDAYSTVANVLRRIDRVAAAKPSDSELKHTLDEERQATTALKRRVQSRIQKQARLYFGWGALCGALVLAPLLVIVGLLVPHYLRVAVFVAAWGALGGVASALTRLRQTVIAYEHGLRFAACLGALRPVVGALFADVIWFALTSNLLPLQVPEGPHQGWAYFFFAFLSGFNERWAVGILESKAQIERDPNSTNSESSHPTQQ